MQYVAIILWTLLLASVATAQQPVTPEQILQNMIAQQAGQIAQLGSQLSKAQARIKELEAKKEEKK